MRRLLTVSAFILICTGTARADYTTRDLAGYCSHVHDKVSGVEQGVCVGYIAALAALWQAQFGRIEVVPTADQFVQFSKSVDQTLPASSTLFTMFYRRQQGTTTVN